MRPLALFVGARYYPAAPTLGVGGRFSADVATRNDPIG
jgi:hypothetical protein